MTLFLNETRPSFNMPWGGAGGGGGNILNIFKLFPEWLPKKKKKSSLLEDWQRIPTLYPKRGTDLMNHKVLIARLPAFFANELIPGQSQRTHINRWAFWGCHIVPCFILHKHLRTELGRAFGTTRRADIPSCLQLKKEGVWCKGVQFSVEDVCGCRCLLTDKDIGEGANSPWKDNIGGPSSSQE